MIYKYFIGTAKLGKEEFIIFSERGTRSYIMKCWNKDVKKFANTICAELNNFLENII